MKRFAYLAIVAIAALPLLLTSGPASAAPSTAKASAPAVYITTVGLLSDGRLQAFRSERGAPSIQSRWQVGSPTGPWTIWVSFPYPPTNAGVSALHAGIQNNITYLYVYTNGGGTWETHKLSTDPNDGWTSYQGVSSVKQGNGHGIWSGWGTSVNQDYTGITGDFQVPTVTGSTNGTVAIWLGLGGVNDALEQTGVSASIVNGKPVYRAWWEVLYS